MRRTTELTLHVVAIVGVVVGLALLLTACGDATTGATGPATSAGGTGDTPVPAAAAVRLEAVGGTDDEPDAWRRTLTCGDTASGAGVADADAACAAVRSAAGRAALDPPSDRICTEIYGGPEVAEITGEVDGRAVRVTVTRSDGCGIADWAALQPFLPAPGAS